MDEINTSEVVEVRALSGLIRGEKVDGRKVYDPKVKRELVKLCLAPGVSIARAAMVNGLNANLLHKWINEHRLGKKPSKRRKAKPTSPEMLSVVVRPAPALAALPGATFEIELARGKVRINHPDAQTLRMVFDLLGAL
jgi:transposase-like protein